MPVVGDYNQVYAPRVFLRALNSLSTDLVDKVVSFKFEENPKSITSVALVIANPDFMFADDPRFVQGVGFDFRWGYDYDVSPLERFIVTRVSMQFPKADTFPTITLEASGYLKLMNFTSQPKNWGPVSSSEIVRQLAARYSLKAAVAESRDARKQSRVQAAIVTDFQYIADLASKLHWEFYIQNDTLYFQPYQLDQQAAGDLSFTYRTDATGTLLSFEPDYDKKPAGISQTGTDARTGKTNSAASLVAVGTTTVNGQTSFINKADTDNVKQTWYANKGNTANGQTKLPNAGGPGMPSPETSALVIGTQVEAQQVRLNMSAQKAKATFIGTPRIRARKVLTINNVGPYSGNWLVTDATHDISAEGGYLVHTQLTRASSKPTTDAKKKAPSSTAGDQPVAVGWTNGADYASKFLNKTWQDSIVGALKQK